MSGRIDDVDDMSVPVDGGGCRSNSDSPHLFQLHRTHKGPHAVLAMHLMGFVYFFSVKQNPLCQRGFSVLTIYRDFHPLTFLSDNNTVKTARSTAKKEEQIHRNSRTIGSKTDSALNLPKSNNCVLSEDEDSRKRLAGLKKS